MARRFHAAPAALSPIHEICPHMSLAIDILGWLAAAALLYAYGAVSFHHLAPGSRLYQGLNIFGSILLIINTG